MCLQDRELFTLTMHARENLENSERQKRLELTKQEGEHIQVLTAQRDMQLENDVRKTEEQLSAIAGQFEVKLNV